MDSVGIVEAFDVVEYCGAEFVTPRPGVALVDPGEFTFERRPEGLNDRVVVAVTGRSERLLEVEVTHASRERE